jgi:hypothetical protein
MDEGNLVNQRLQAMYDQIASRAGENVQRIGDIYGGATAGIGEVYDRSIGSVGDAYASSQQQAADQLARLGIEEAAPAILDPMSRSQAESQALLEAGRASGLGAAQRYGASSGDFASQMAQVAQQEGAQYQTGVADALRRQLMNLEVQAQQEAYQRAMNAPGLAGQLYEASQLGLPQPEQVDLDFEFKRDQANIDNYYRYYSDLMQNQPGSSPEELHTAVRDYIITGAMGEDMKQWILQGNDPGLGLSGSMPTNAPSATFSSPPPGGVPFFSNIGEQFSNIFGR